MKLTHHKDGVYNLSNFEWGYTTATRIQDPVRVSTYIAKYLTKEITVPKGRKRYWASRNLVKPQEDYLVISKGEFYDLFHNARFQRVMNSPYGMYFLCEIEGKGETP